MGGYASAHHKQEEQLMTSVCDGDVEAVEELLERGVDVNLQDDALKGERNSAVVCSGGGAQDNRVSTSPCPESRAGGVRGGGPNRSWPFRVC